MNVQSSLRSQQSNSGQGSVAEVLAERVNPDSKYHLVLVHGIGDSSDVWREVCTQLPAQFRSYQELSLPWVTAVGEPISYEPAPEVVLRDTWQKLPPGPKVVLAHSFGANSILAMVQNAPLVDVEAMVMISVYSKQDYAEFTWPMFERYIGEFEKFIATSVAARPGSSALSDASKKLVIDKSKELYSPSSWIQFYRLFSQTPGLDLSSLTMPLLVLTGSEDFSIELADITQFAARFSNSEFHCMENCGHFSLIEQPAYTAKLISKFLNERKIL